jgi:succinate dehydrogenase / fumarate reductase membrane anchor subunit
MVSAVTSLGKSGVASWVIQRVSALVLAAYTVFIVAFLVCNSPLEFSVWSDLFSQLWVRIFSFAALLSIAAHGWIGLWAVLTDYVTDRIMGGKALGLRALALGAYAVVTFSYLVWGIEILWGF